MLFEKAECIDYRYDVTDQSVDGLLILPLYGSMPTGKHTQLCQIEASVSFVWCYCDVIFFSFFFFFCLRSTTADLSATTSKNKKVCRGHKHCCNLSHHQWHKVSKDCRSSGLTVSLTPFGKHIVMLFLSTFRYIVDSGFVKQLNHNSRVGMDILEVVPISK